MSENEGEKLMTQGQAAKAKAPKAPKAPKVPKAPKAPKAPKGKSKGKIGVQTRLPGTRKAPAVKPGEATHYTEAGTRKYQANGPVAWAAIFRKAAGPQNREGVGIRLGLAYAAEHSEAFMKWVQGKGDGFRNAVEAAK